MAKKKPSKRDEEPALPKFGGFKPLAGLKDFKAKLDADAAKEKEKEKESAAKGNPSSNAKPAPAHAPRSVQPRPKPSTSSESAADDELSFHRMMSGVVPLEGTKARVPVTSDAGPSTPRVKPAELRDRAREEAARVLDHLHQLVDDGARFEVSDDGKHVEGRRADVSPSVLRTLRRGLLPVDARLDLHGATTDEARERLLKFLRDTRARGERCVLVIHGKGEHSASPGGVLRGEIAAWLSQGRAREHVAAFATAREDDGGEGAVYVALRR